MRARAAWVLVAGLSFGCGDAGDGYEEADLYEHGVLIDACTGDEVGYLTERGDRVFHDGRMLPPPDMDPNVRWDVPLQDVCTSSHPAGEPSMAPQDTGTGSVAATDHAVCVPFVFCCQEVWAEWCWNGSCSSDYEEVCEWW